MIRSISHNRAYTSQPPHDEGQLMDSSVHELSDDQLELVRGGHGTGGGAGKVNVQDLSFTHYVD